MIKITTTTFFDAPKMQRIVDKAAFRNFGHAGNRIMKDARDSIKKAPPESRRRAKRKRGVVVRRGRHAASPPGTPPFTGRGQLKRAIFYRADKDGAVIGPVASRVGTSATAHEFGGEYKGERYPERAFMFPALRRNVYRFATDWRGSIGE